jgi:hypothetical protein
VRGDSLRDFYAKTLAVVGLGLLAGAGAIVDYWPVGSPLPVVQSAALPTPVAPVLAQRLDLQVPLPRAEGPARARAALRAANLGTARFLTATLPALVPTRTVSPVVDPAPASVAAVPDVSLSVSDGLAELLEPQQMAWHEVEPPRLQMAPASGLIGGALRKTKDSIVRTGAATGSTLAATGSTIADAFKGVVGAFKKVSPF